MATSGRARPWRTTQVSFTTGPAGTDREKDAAAEVLADVVIQRATERHRQWQRRPEDEWTDIAGVSQTIWWVTQEEAQELSEEIGALVGRYRERLAQRGERPAHARPVEFLALVHPIEEQ